MEKPCRKSGISGYGRAFCVEIIIDKKNPTCYIFYRTMTFSKGEVCERGVPCGASLSFYFRKR